MPEPRSPLFELTKMKALEFYRDPGTLFWVFGFPILLAVALGLAFRNRPPDPIHVVVSGSPALVAALEADPSLEVLETDAESARWRVRRGQADLFAQDVGGQLTFRFDETRPEGRLARLAVERAVQRSRGQPGPPGLQEEKVTEAGSRYIDFLVPGLIGMNVMGSSIWGLGFAIVDARKRKLLKRLAATPMRRHDYLLSLLLFRVIFLVAETAALVTVGTLVFGVAVQGSLAAVGVLSLLGGLAFAGLALLIGSRTASTEVASGLMNFAMMPMYLLSGAFFSASHFPDWLQPLIQALPLTALNNALRAVINEAAPLSSQGMPMVIMALWGVVPFAIALRIFRWQ